MPSRRNFFTHIIGSLVVFAEELRGVPQLKLADIAKLPNENAGKIIPKLNETISYSIENGLLKEINKKTGESKTICELSSVEEKIFMMFYERNTLQEISIKIAGCFSLTEEETFQTTRNLFLRLLNNNVCFPANAIDHEDA